MIVLDGSEGGGQMLRTALALSALTTQPFRMTNIRAARPNPGLKPQHYTCVKTLQEMTKAKTDAELGTKEITFIPEKYKASNKTIDIGTAGSITLLLQSIMLPAMFSGKAHTLTIKGGTDVKWSMPIDYFTHILVPQLRRYAGIEVRVLKRGYYPKGGGEVQIKIVPGKIEGKSIELTQQGQMLCIKGVSHASKQLQEAQVAERQAQAAKQALSEYETDISVEYADTCSAGSGITLWAVMSKTDEVEQNNPIVLGADSLGERGKPAEKVGKEAAEKLRKLLKTETAADEHLADNLVPLMALFKPSKIETTEITQHIKTNISVTEAFLGECFKITENMIETY